MELINLEEFKDLKSTLENKQKFRFTIYDYREKRSKEIKKYRLVDTRFKGNHDFLDYVSIDIYNDRVELHCNGDGAITPTYKFTSRDLIQLNNKNNIDFLESCIKSGIYAWDKHFD